MDRKGEGWLVFASIMLVLAGIYNFIWGITALAKDEYLINQFLFANLTFWGWFWLIIGVIAVIAGFAVLNKSQWARWFGIIMASISAIGMFTVIWAYPIWSILIIVLDVMVIYGLTEYGSREAGA